MEAHFTKVSKATRTGGAYALSTVLYLLIKLGVLLLASVGISMIMLAVIAVVIPPTDANPWEVWLHDGWGPRTSLAIPLVFFVLRGLWRLFDAAMEPFDSVGSPM